jgi:hypothetical protein
VTLPSQPLDLIPSWAFYLITVGLVLPATEVDFRTGVARPGALLVA